MSIHVCTSTPLLSGSLVPRNSQSENVRTGGLRDLGRRHHHDTSTHKSQFLVEGYRIQKKGGSEYYSEYYFVELVHFWDPPGKYQKKTTQYVRRVGTPNQKPILYTVQQCHVWKCIENASRWNFWHHFSFSASLRVEESTSLGTRKRVHHSHRHPASTMSTINHKFKNLL